MIPKLFSPENMPFSLPVLVALGVTLSIFLLFRGNRKRPLQPALAKGNLNSSWITEVPSLSDRRTSVRRAGTPVKILATSPAFKNGTKPGYVLDRSTGADAINAWMGERAARESRVPFGRAVIALPAGLVGDGPGDDGPEAAAVRELAEEAGFIAKHWRSVGEFATSPGMSSETYHFYIATGLERIGPGGGVAGEDITVHIVPLRQIGAFTAAARERGAVIDAKLLALLAFAEAA